MPQRPISLTQNTVKPRVMSRLGQIKKMSWAVASGVKEHLSVVLCIGGLAISFFCLWQRGGPEWKDFGLNAFTETIGIGITVFLVDQLLKKQELRRRRPLEIAAFHDVEKFASGLATFWTNVYNWSGKDEMEPPQQPLSTEVFLTLPYFQQIRRRLNLNAEACVFPKRNWWTYLPQVENQYRQLGEKILERHSAALDPYAYQLVHKVLNGFLDSNLGLSMLPVLKEAGGFGDNDIWDKLPEHQRHRLGRYWIVQEKNLEDFAALHKWYLSHRKEFLGHD